MESVHVPEEDDGPPTGNSSVELNSSEPLGEQTMGTEPEMGGVEVNNLVDEMEKGNNISESLRLKPTQKEKAKQPQGNKNSHKL